MVVCPSQEYDGELEDTLPQEYRHVTDSPNLEERKVVDRPTLQDALDTFSHWESDNDDLM